PGEAPQPQGAPRRPEPPQGEAGDAAPARRPAPPRRCRARRSVRLRSRLRGPRRVALSQQDGDGASVGAPVLVLTRRACASAAWEPLRDLVSTKKPCISNSLTSLGKFILDQFPRSWHAPPS